MFAVPRGWNAAAPGRWIGGRVTGPRAVRADAAPACATVRPAPTGSPGPHPRLQPRQEGARPDPGAEGDPSTRHWLWTDGRCPQGAGAGSTRSPLAGLHTPARLPPAPWLQLPQRRESPEGSGRAEGAQSISEPCAIPAVGAGVTLPGTPGPPPPSPSRAAGSGWPVTLRPQAAGQCCLPVPVLGSPEPPCSHQTELLLLAPPGSAPSFTPHGQRGLRQGDPIHPHWEDWDHPACAGTNPLLIPRHSVSPRGPQSVSLPSPRGWTGGSLWGTANTSPHRGRSVTWHLGGQDGQMGHSRRGICPVPGDRSAFSHDILSMATAALGPAGAALASAGAAPALPGPAPGAGLRLSIKPPHSPTPAQAPWPSHSPGRGQARGGLAATLLHNGVPLVALPVPAATPELPALPRTPPPAPCPSCTVPAVPMAPGCQSQPMQPPGFMVPHPCQTAMPVSLSPAGSPAALRWCCWGRSYGSGSLPAPHADRGQCVAIKQRRPGRAPRYHRQDAAKPPAPARSPP